MSNTVSRRQTLQAIAGAALSGSLTLEAAQHVHAAAEEAKAAGPYKPKALTAAEFRTLETLCELIVPGAKQGGAAEFIDLLSAGNPQMAQIYTAGIAWLNAEMRHRYNAEFTAAAPEQRTALLDLIAYRKNDSPELGPGIRFFEWARRMTVDAYFTSKAGIAEIGFQGNGAMSEFQVPVAALEYALKRSPLA